MKAAKIMNPRQFELPRDMRVPCLFPGTDKGKIIIIVIIIKCQKITLITKSQTREFPEHTRRHTRHAHLHKLHNYHISNWHVFIVCFIVVPICFVKFKYLVWQREIWCLKT